MLALLNGRLITPFRVENESGMIVENNKIAQMGKIASLRIPPGCRTIDLDGKMVMPGFIDLHIHGVGGFDFNKVDFNDAGRIMEILFSHGVTSFLATLTPEPFPEMIRLVRRYAEYIERKKTKTTLRGIHCEGPFLNPEMRGAINPDFLWDADLDKWNSLYEAGRGSIRLMTIAPELPGCMEIIREAARNGVVLSLGHSNADYDVVTEAIDNGIAQVTHIYNAMPLTHHRSPGILGAAYLSDELKVQLIADGIHVHPITIRFLMKLKGANGIILISDATHMAGQPDGVYDFSGKKIRVRGGNAYTEDNVLAGSTLTMDLAVKNLVEKCDVPVTQAARMASLNSAKVIRQDHRKGILAVGKDADLVVLNDDFSVEMTVQNGEIVFDRQSGKSNL